MFNTFLLILSVIFALEWADKKDKDWKDYLVFLAYVIVLLVAKAYL